MIGNTVCDFTRPTIAMQAREISWKRFAPPCGQTTCEAWRGEARAFRLPRLHALLHAIAQMGLVRHRAQDDQEADVETVAGGQDGVAQANARSHRRDRGV